MSLEASRDYVLEQAKANIELLKSSPASVAQAQQINASLATIVAMERNMVMHRALERSLRPHSDENLQRLPEHQSSPPREERDANPLPRVLSGQTAQGVGGKPGQKAGGQPEKLREARRKAAG